MAKFKEIESQLGALSATSSVKGKLSKARRALKKVKIDKALSEYAMAIDLLKLEIQWRNRAVTELQPAITAYDEAIKMTIGIRLQERLSLEQAKSIASCLSVHRDVSLNF